MTSPTPAVDPAHTAVVLIEYQNDFTTEGGTLHGAVSSVMDSTGMLKNTVDLVGKARDAGATIVHTPISFAAGYGEISSRPYGILAGVVDSNSFVKGSWGAEITEEMTPVDGDIVIEGKRGFDAFASTNLDFILRSKGITTIALGGFLTNCCVESTMRTGYEKGYQVYTLTDCLAATSIEEHDNAIGKDYPMFSRPVTSIDFVAALTGDDELADNSRGY
jgi:nicotinamidase-related amidase